MTSKRHWGLHGYAINSYKKKLEVALARLPADAPGRAHIERILDQCEEFLNDKELLEGGDVIDKKSLDVVVQWIDGLLQAHPEFKEGIRG